MNFTLSFFAPCNATNQQHRTPPWRGFSTLRFSNHSELFFSLKQQSFILATSSWDCVTLGVDGLIVTKNSSFITPPVCTAINMFQIIKLWKEKKRQEQWWKRKMVSWLFYLNQQSDGWVEEKKPFKHTWTRGFHWSLRSKDTRRCFSNVLSKDGGHAVQRLLDVGTDFL